MTKDPPENFPPTGDVKLSTHEAKALLSAIEKATQAVIAKSIKRLRRYFFLAGSLLTIFCFVSVWGLRTSIKDGAVAALREDSALRESIRIDVGKKAVEVTDIVKQLRAEAEQLEREKREGNIILQQSLKDIDSLLDQLRGNSAAKEKGK